MQVFVQISNVGFNAGPFTLTANNGASVIPNTFTKAQLLAGQSVILTNNNATIITITSSGICTNSQSVVINLSPVTTTISSSTSTSTTTTTTTVNAFPNP